MQITKELLVCEIEELEREAEKARTFLLQAQASISAYRMLSTPIEAPEPTEQ